jgi:hypothetical protein
MVEYSLVSIRITAMYSLKTRGRHRGQFINKPVRTKRQDAAVRRMEHQLHIRDRRAQRRRAGLPYA